MTVDPAPVIAPEAPEVKRFRREGMGYIWELPRHQLVFRADYIHRARENVTASIVVESTAPGVQPHVFRGRIGLESATSQRDLVKFLEDLTKLPDSTDGDGVPWKRMVHGFCAALLKEQENTAKIVYAGQLPRQEGPRWKVDKIIAAEKPTILYGDGSAGKGYLVTAMCVAMTAGHPLGNLAVTPSKVLYLDWEDDEYTFNERIQAISQGWGIAPPEIAHAVMTESFERHHRWIAKMVTEHEFDTLVIDSVGLAGGTVGERGSYEDVALNLFRQVKAIPAKLTTIMIDHVNSEGRGDNDGVPTKGFGSVYKGYLARSTWFVKKDQDEESDVLHMGLYHTKTNTTAKSKPLGFKITFHNRGQDLIRVDFESEDVRQNDTLARSLPAWQRIKEHLLSVRRATCPDIADELGLPADSVRTELGRRKSVFVKLDNNHWGVLHHDQNTNVTPIRSPYRSSTIADSDGDLPFG